MPARIRVPAERLEGLTLAGGWKVTRQCPRAKDPTGGTFSIGYEVENADGRKGFLKALNYARAMREPNRAAVLQAMTAAYLWELRVLGVCRARRMDRVVYAIEEGKVDVDDSELGSIDYLIFELADGDIRIYMERMTTFDSAWAARTLHCTAVGLQQLHSENMAHQDLKPSNVLVFNPTLAKLADLGRVVHRVEVSPHDGQAIAGDPFYAPPEQLYKAIPTGWPCHRIGGDLYHLGSLALFLFANVGATAAVISRIPPGYHPNSWSGPYEEVLPYLRAALDDVANEVDGALDQPLKHILPRMIRELCDPDPMLRGHPLDRLGKRNRFSVERYVSAFDLLALRLEMELKRRPGIVGNSA